ncbi:DNA (cytosine-5)-methyltransferase DRM2-like [Dorcoceras hygrometricum]|uniref:DNA (Cytosine-5)-methyltransferase DRM2-like n=1 Tax=Dorcoceras hygrometricum TaxID=472368 RepID=A0A2Z7CDU3_9LAMI|nr:DNA (cytosine-5)-methyltransferase DRM2-like [Dorcoceras hygrometricum]
MFTLKASKGCSIVARNHQFLPHKFEQEHGALTTRNQQLSRSSPRSFCSFKWVAIEREVHREPSATENTQIFDGERRKSREESLGEHRKLSSRNYPVATIQSQAIQKLVDSSQLVPDAILEMQRFTYQNDVALLPRMVPQFPAGHPVAVQFLPQLVLQFFDWSFSHERNDCQTQHKPTVHRTLSSLIASGRQLRLKCAKTPPFSSLLAFRPSLLECEIYVARTQL